MMIITPFAANTLVYWKALLGEYSKGHRGEASRGPQSSAHPDSVAPLPHPARHNHSMPIADH